MKKEDAKILLNLDNNINVVKIEKKQEGKVNVNYVHVKSKRKKARCTHCNNFSSKIHDYLKPSKITYLKSAENFTYLIVYKRRFYCNKCKKSFTENLGLSSNGCFVSNKVKQLVLKKCMDRDMTLEAIALECNISVDLVRKIFLEAAKNIPDNVETLPEIISFDEVSTKTKEGLYSFVLNDPIHKITLDILPNRKKDFLIKYFLKVNNRKSVKVVICDLYKPYYDVVKICFPNAIFVADPFHYTRYVIEGLDNVRIRLEHLYENDKKSKEYKLLKNRLNKRLLLKSFNETKAELKKQQEEKEKYEKGLTNKKPKNKFNDFWYGKIKIKRNDKYIEVYRIDRLQDVLNLNDDLAKAYNLKEEFLRITTHVKYEEAKRQLKKWIKDCKESEIPEMIEASKTIENWLKEILNSFKDERYSNGFTEANNNTIDKIIDRAYGYKNFKFFRLRTLVILNKSYSGGSRKNIENGQK
ncbi:MAG: ISL3 family transposase [Candidatus Scatovivens sp.]